MYDLVVVGGGTAGCAAAYIAGKLGLKVLLLEKSVTLGGSMTTGLVVPTMQSSKNQINTEFFNDLISKLHEMKGQITYQNNAGWFNPELCKIALDSLLLKANVEVRFKSSVYKIIHKNQHIQTLYINKQNLSVYNEKIDFEDKTLFEPIATRYILDSTGNCEIGKILNCNFLKDNSEFQPMSLRFMMGGVKVKEFANWINRLDKDRNVTTKEVIDGVYHCSTAYTWDKHWALEPYFKDAVRQNILKNEDRNYFQLFTVAGMVDTIAFNCPRIIEKLSPNEVCDVSKAVIQGRQSIYRILQFCKTYLKGFENAYISNIADDIGIRVSNRIKGKYIYTQEDLVSGKKFDNPAVISDYPIDVHSSEKNKSVL